MFRSHPHVPALLSRPRGPRLLVRWLAGLLAVPTAVGLAIVPAVASAPVAAPAAAAATDSPCPQSQGSPAWELSTSTFDPAFYRHATVGNGYLGLRVPPAGMGYVSTGEPTGWPLFTPRYDGAIVAGLYARDPDLAGGRQAIAAIPNWSTLTVGAGGETFTPTTAASRITQLPADPLPALRSAPHVADLDHEHRQPGDRPRLRRAGRPGQGARGRGPADA